MTLSQGMSEEIDVRNLLRGAREVKTPWVVANVLENAGCRLQEVYIEGSAVRHVHSRKYLSGDMGRLSQGPNEGRPEMRREGVRSNRENP